MKISNNVYCLDSTKSSYVYVIIQDNETILIDTGMPLKTDRIVNELKSLGVNLKDIKHILLTHHDIDHIGNAADLQRLTGAEVWASKEDIPYILGSSDRHSFKKYFKYFLKYKKPINIKPFISEAKINEIEIIPTPGHTPGHVCFLYNEILFVGDLLENKNGVLRPYPSLWNWDNDIMRRSIHKLSHFSFKLVCAAHGGVRPL